MMRVWTSIPAWRERRRELSDGRIGFVPTMGALHQGHAALVERCRRENDIVVVSIFVNPSQFNDIRDLKNYPQTLDSDLRLLEQLGVDEVLAPPAQEMYPNGYGLRVVPVDQAPVMEAAFRPGFLEGVLTVVLKLFNLVRADRAYFGEKDYQQLRAVTDLAGEFFCSTEILPCPTVREASGLALSSRNARLSSEGRAKAVAVFEALTSAGGVEEARRLLEARGLTVEYVEERWGRRLAAVVIDAIRLIDNVSPEEVRHADGT